MAKIKCAITGEKIDKTFLNKPLGISIRHEGKTYWVCSAAQKQYENNKELILEAILEKQ